MDEQNEDNIVTLIDEDGSEVQLEHLDTLEISGGKYVFFVPASEAADEDDDAEEVVVFRVEADENGEEVLAMVDDEDEIDRAYDEFKKKNADVFEFE